MTITGSLSQILGLGQQQTVDEAYERRIQQGMAAQQACNSVTNGGRTSPLQQASTANITLGNLAQNASGWLTANATHTAFQTPTMTDLKDGAWDVPISQLQELWLVKHGSKWVEQSDLDAFYMIAAQRLGKLFKVEQLYVNGVMVYRIVE